MEIGIVHSQVSKRLNGDVRVPLAASYELEDGKITRGQVHFEMSVYFSQVEANLK